ncbi:MAG: hypothetical protein U0350_25050 [Caldilineaceae bacterium]
MSYRQLHQYVISLALITFFLAGCAPIKPVSEASAGASIKASASASPTPTVRPPKLTPTQAPTSTPLATPKIGHWEGKPSISFDLTSAGEISNFKITVSIPQLGDCEISIEKFAIAVSAQQQGTRCLQDGTICFANIIKPDGTFMDTAFIKDINVPETTKSFMKDNNLWPTPVQTGAGEMFEMARISGKFESPTTLTGDYKILICQDQFTTPAEEGAWQAEWKR